MNGEHVHVIAIITTLKLEPSPKTRKSLLRVLNAISFVKKFYPTYRDSIKSLEFIIENPQIEFDWKSTQESEYRQLIKQFEINIKRDYNVMPYLPNVG